MPFFARDGVDLYYEIHGEGPPLLLIPGLATNSQTWATILPGLSSRYRTIVVDNRGSGRTSPGDARLDIEAMADGCAALIGHLGLASVAVLGHSMGGFVAQACALRHPER